MASRTFHESRHVDENKLASAVTTAAARLGLPDLKPCQEKAVKTFVMGQDLFLSLPTGYGKSFCYSSLPLIYDCLKEKESPYSIVIVVSPLQALMKEQALSLLMKGVQSIYIQDKFDNEDETIRARVSAGDYSIIFISPELLLGDKSWVDVFRSKRYHDCLVGIAVDEAHCIKKWYITINVYSCTNNT